MGVMRFERESGGALWTREVAQAWERDGCVVLEGVVSSGDCDALVRRGCALFERAKEAGEVTGSVFGSEGDRDRYFLESGGEVRFFFEEGAEGLEWGVVNKVGHALHDRDEVFGAFSRRGDWEEVVLGAGVGDPRLVQSMLILKHPRVGGEVMWHQDGTYLRTEPDTVVGLWFALEDATVENGCMWAVLGSHRGEIGKRYEREGEGAVLRDVGGEERGLGEAVALEVKKGGMVVLHGALVHGSAANRSKKARPAYAVHIVDGRARWSPRNWLQREEPFSGF